jgi:tetratricopeptide (TPR) repeat protein
MYHRTIHNATVLPRAMIPARMNVNFLQQVSSSAVAKRQSGNIYNRIVRILIYAATVILPLFYLPFTSSVLEYNKQLLLIVVASVGLIVWLLGIVVSGKLTIRTTPIDKGVGAVLIAAIVATIFSVVRIKSIFGLATSLSSSLITIAALSVFYFLIVNTLHDRGRMLRSALSLSAALALVLGLAQMFTWYFLPGAFTHSRAFDLVGSLNSLGILAGVCLALFAKTGIRGAIRFDAIVAGVGIVAGILVLAILNWWVFWAVALAGMLAIIGFDSLNAARLAQDYGQPKRGRFALSRFIIPMTVIVLGAFLLLVNFNPVSLKQNFPTEINPSQRVSWHVTRQVMEQKLLYGYGPENFSLAFDRFGASEMAETRLASTRFFDAFSEAFTVAVHGGILALLALAILLGCIVQVIMRFSGAISASATRGESAIFAAKSSGTLAAVVAMSTALFLYPFNITLLFIWYVLLALAGLIVAGDRSRTIDIEERPLYSLFASIGFIIALILVLTALYSVVTMYLADSRYARALSATTPSGASDGLARAIALNGANDQYLRDASQAMILVLRDEAGGQGNVQDLERTTRIQNLMASAVQLAQRATQVAPLESLNWNNLGLVYQSLTGLVDNVEQLAEDAFSKASQLRPGDPGFDNEIGALWLARADLLQQIARGGARAQALTPQINDSLARAETAFKRALDLSPNFGLAIYNLGAVYDRQGRVDEAIAQLERIAPYNANDPSLMFELGLLYIRANRHADAVLVLQRAVLLAPQYSNARWYLALLLEEKGDLDGALAQLYEIQKSNPDNEALQQKITQLEAGKQSIPPARVIDSEPLQ